MNSYDACAGLDAWLDYEVRRHFEEEDWLAELPDEPAPEFAQLDALAEEEGNE